MVRAKTELMPNSNPNKTEGECDGAFLSSLKRNNKQIRGDRASSISEDTEITYKRVIEDLRIDLKRVRRTQEAMLDLSPTDATSLRLANDFDSSDYVVKDLNLGLNARNLEIKLEVAEARYEYLFGGKV